ncbi:hypothetical protein [Streptomyces sp. ISL-99]|uniref:hypothetical protein n=1 Tax=Streptomyces sp. ISL-99 TaxID=2819193 RepID=UPI0035B28B62
MTDRTPRPATGPAKETRPEATARTGSPGPAARSTPRCPAAYGEGGGSQDRTTGGRSPTGHTAASGIAPAMASGGGVSIAVIRASTSTVIRRIHTPSRDETIPGDHDADLWIAGRLWTSPSPGTA